MKFLVLGNTPVASLLMYLSSYPVWTIPGLGKFVCNARLKKILSGDSFTSSSDTVVENQHTIQWIFTVTVNLFYHPNYFF